MWFCAMKTPSKIINVWIRHFQMLNLNCIYCPVVSKIFVEYITIFALPKYRMRLYIVVCCHHLPGSVRGFLLYKLCTVYCTPTSALLQSDWLHGKDWHYNFEATYAREISLLTSTIQTWELWKCFFQKICCNMIWFDCQHIIDPSWKIWELLTMSSTPTKLYKTLPGPLRREEKRKPQQDHSHRWELYVCVPSKFICLLNISVLSSGWISTWASLTSSPVVSTSSTICGRRLRPPPSHPTQTLPVGGEVWGPLLTRHCLYCKQTHLALVREFPLTFQLL